jgi:hypothetical protein
MAYLTSFQLDGETAVVIGAQSQAKRSPHPSALGGATPQTRPIRCLRVVAALRDPAKPGSCDRCAPLGQVGHERSLSDGLPRACPNVAGTASGRGRSAPAELSGSRNSRM